MAGTPQFVDISSFQSATIDWKAYRAWAAQWDGIARVSLKTTEGTGLTDAHFHAYREGALAAGVDRIIYYHYGRPDLNAANAEADYQKSIVGNIRANDLIMLDYEQNVPQATAAWAYTWLTRQQQNYGSTPIIYSYLSFIQSRLQDSRLAQFPLVYANWQFTTTERPASPAPWKSYQYLQFTDKATSIPGIPGSVDCNIYLGGGTMPVPTGWKDDGTTLTATNGVPVVHGFREYILGTATWNGANVPQEAEYSTSQVLLHNASVGAGSRQCFRDNLLWYTAAKGVVQEPYLGLELDAAYKQIATLQAQIATLNAQAVAAQPAGGDTDALTRLSSVENNDTTPLKKPGQI